METCNSSVFLEPEKGSVHSSDQFAQDRGPSQDMELRALS